MTSISLRTACVSSSSLITRFMQEFNMRAVRPLQRSLSGHVTSDIHAPNIFCVLMSQSAPKVNFSANLEGGVWPRFMHSVSIISRKAAAVSSLVTSFRKKCEARASRWFCHWAYKSQSGKKGWKSLIAPNHLISFSFRCSSRHLQRLECVGFSCVISSGIKFPSAKWRRSPPFEIATKPARQRRSFWGARFGSLFSSHTASTNTCTGSSFY